LRGEKGSLTEENNRLKKELDKTVNMMEEAAHRFSMDLSTAQMSLLKFKTHTHIRIEELTGKVIMLQSEIKTGEGIIQDLQEKLSVQERDYLDKLRISKEEDWSKELTH